TAWDGSGARALDPAVEIAIDDVVEGAAGAAHHHGADAEERHQPPIRPSLRRERDAPPAGKEQQPGADGAVEPGKPRIGPKPCRGEAVDPIAHADIGHGARMAGRHAKLKLDKTLLRLEGGEGLG